MYYVSSTNVPSFKYYNSIITACIIVPYNICRCDSDSRFIGNTFLGNLSAGKRGFSIYKLRRNPSFSVCLVWNRYGILEQRYRRSHQIAIPLGATRRTISWLWSRAIRESRPTLTTRTFSDLLPCVFLMNAPRHLRNAVTRQKITVETRNKNRSS